MSLSNITKDHAAVGFSISKGVLIVPVQVELYDDVLYHLQQDALAMIHRYGLHGLLVDLSQLKVMDYQIAKQLSQLLKMAALLGAEGRVTGLQPGVVAAMVEWDELWQGVETALTLDLGIEELNAA